ncbi:hypothetical protein EUX98_g5338 [Antrodiella citrinella]|uniref:DH domain-containing protein n=1 Tax=Antrodiella citrinella TaxID=2447956 RepID=A0A4S4MZK2_9APHY|nr:hypothetical protein EUX98_g5338 [Antrodiella citrinella]
MSGRIATYFKPSKWALEPEESTFAPSSRWSNKDMDPVPPSQRTWTTFNYVAYWISDATNPAVWELASSMLAIGLSWKQALPAIAVGHIIIAAVMVLNGTAGARLHVAFPVLNRSSFGFWFSYFSVRIRWLFLVKAIIVPPSWLAMLIWAFVKVPASSGFFDQKSTLSGSNLSWAWLSALNAALGIYGTLAVNIPDFTRYAKDERAQYVQLIIIPVAFTLCGFVGIAVTSAGTVLYGEIIWDPLLLIDRWDNRAAAFFASLMFVLTTLGTNISANSLSAANDMTVLFPRYINIRRGQVICAILGGWALCPWEILAKYVFVAIAQGFLSFMNGYTVFLGPFAGIMVADSIAVVLMYLRCTVLMANIGIHMVPFTLPGLISSINPKIKVGRAAHLFDIAWLFGFFVAAFVYYVSSTLFPAKETYVDDLITTDELDADHNDSDKASSSVEKGGLKDSESVPLTMEAISKLASPEIPVVLQPSAQAFFPLLKAHTSDIESVKRSTFQYGSTDRHQLDVYYPTDVKGEKAPILFFSYGGGFVSGARNLPAPADLMFRNVGAFFAKRGIFTVIADYRLVPHAKFPDGPEDVKDAVAWVVDHPEEVAGDSAVKPDTDRIFLLGHSAGANHVITTFLLPDLLPANIRTRTKGVILNGAPYTFRPELIPNAAGMGDVLEKYYGPGQSVYEKEPLTLLLSASRELLDSLPPIIASRAEREPDSILQANLHFLKAIREKRPEAGAVEEYIMKGHNHHDQADTARTDVSGYPDVPTRNRTSSLSRSLSRVKNGRGDGRDNGDGKDKDMAARRSQFVDLPLLETQLLPSLRDTIDRMTHPPTRSSKTHADDQYVSQIQNQSSSKKHSPYVPPQTPHAPMASARYEDPVKLAQARARPSKQDAVTNLQCNPKISTALASQESTTPSLRTPRLKSRQQSPAIGNSSLTRYAMPERLEPSGGEQHATRPTLQVDYVRSQKQSPMHDYQVAPSSSSRSPAPSSSKKQAKSTPPTPRHAATPKMSPYPATPSGMNPARQTPRSGIPRPSATADSDLVEEYGRHITSGRLVVTNGSANHSSSEDEVSEFEADMMRRPTLGTRSPRANKDDPSRWTARPPDFNDNYSRVQSRVRPDKTVGLGLSLLPYDRDSDQYDPHHWESSEDDRSVDEEAVNYDEVGRLQEAHLDKPRGAWDIGTDKKQQDALAGIVNGLDVQFGWYPPGTGKSRLSQGESEYNTSGIGMAIGETRDFQRDGLRVSADSTRGASRSPRRMQEQAHEYTPQPDDDGRSTRSRDRRRAEQPPTGSQRLPDRSARRSISQPPATKPSNQVDARTLSSHARGAQDGQRGAAYSGRLESDRAEKSRHRVSMSTCEIPDVNMDRIPNEMEAQSSRRAGAYPAQVQRKQKMTASEAATREREGFGIPTSLSFRGSDEQEDVHGNTSHHLQATRGSNLPHAESDLSTLGGTAWEENAGHPGDQLSGGAEALFRELSGKTSSVDDRGSRKHRRRGMTMGNATATASGQAMLQPPEPRENHARHSRSVSLTSSAPSMYEEQPSPPQEEHVDEPDYSEVEGWRSAMPTDAYKTLLARFGPQEMRRQNAIYEFFGSEDTFTSQLRMILRQFIRPLRHKDSKEWLPGIPATVTRLFDWFDDIINLHLGMAIAIKGARRTWRTGEIIVKLTDIFIGFTPRLEIYQPYLARFQSVTDTISQCASDGGSEFGEFVKIREQDPECGGWTLPQLLYEPVRHLGTYPETFLRISQLTPRYHPDHLSMLSLYHSSRMVMRVMHEVRKREETYEMFKQITSDIEGLPSSLRLANRERHLLWHGPLLVTLTRMDENNDPSTRHADSERRNTPRIVIGDETDPRPGGRSRQQRTGSLEEPTQVQMYVLTDLVLFAPAQINIICIFQVT